MMQLHELAPATSTIVHPGAVHISAAEAQWKPGDRVVWAHVPRGGYGFGQKVAAVVAKIGPKRIQIAVMRLVPYSRPSRWQQEMKWVPVEHLSARELPCSAFGEAMLLEVAGFKLTGWKHPNGAARAFPNGVWYGAVDGYTCTGPSTSEEHAVSDALGALLGGAYRATLQTSIGTFKNWISTGQDNQGKGAAEIPDLEQRLAKFAAAIPELSKRTDFRCVDTCATKATPQ